MAGHKPRISPDYAYIISMFPYLRGSKSSYFCSSITNIHPFIVQISIFLSKQPPTSIFKNSGPVDSAHVHSSASGKFRSQANWHGFARQMFPSLHTSLLNTPDGTATRACFTSRIFFAKFKFNENFIYSNLDVTTNICTCNDSAAVSAYAIFCGDMILVFGEIEWRIFVKSLYRFGKL